MLLASSWPGRIRDPCGHPVRLTMHQLSRLLDDEASCADPDVLLGELVLCGHSQLGWCGKAGREAFLRQIVILSVYARQEDAQLLQHHALRGKFNCIPHRQPCRRTAVAVRQPFESQPDKPEGQQHM